MIELRKPEGIPMTSSRATTAMTAATAAPAIFNGFMSTFPANSTTQVPALYAGSIPRAYRLNGRSLKRGSEIIRIAAKLCDLWHTSERWIPRIPCLGDRRYCNEQTGRICGHFENESDVR